MSCAPSRVEAPPVVNVTGFKILTPPEGWLTDCPSKPSDDTIGGELLRLDDVVRCEWDQNKVLRMWLEDVQKDHT